MTEYESKEEVVDAAIDKLNASNSANLRRTNLQVFRERKHSRQHYCEGTESQHAVAAGILR